MATFPPTDEWIVSNLHPSKIAMDFGAFRATVDDYKSDA